MHAGVSSFISTIFEAGKLGYPDVIRYERIGDVAMMTLNKLIPRLEEASGFGPGHACSALCPSKVDIDEAMNCRAVSVSPQVMCNILVHLSPLVSVLPGAVLLPESISFCA